MTAKSYSQSRKTYNFEDFKAEEGSREAKDGVEAAACT